MPEISAYGFDAVASADAGVETLISHGHAATARQFPWHVSIVRPDTDGSKLVHVAGGVVIAPKYVLTVAHVVRPVKEYHLRFNSVKLWSGGETQVSHKAIIHPKYNEATLENNIAIIVLPQSLALSRKSPIQAARLPCSNDVQPTLTGQRARLSGHGMNEDNEISSRLRFVDLQIIDNLSCSAFYRDRITSNTLCAVGWFSRRANACGGDSGGALSIRHNDAWLPVGLTSFGALDRCTQGFPSGYTRLANYVQWIEKETNIKTGCNHEAEIDSHEDW